MIFRNEFRFLTINTADLWHKKNSNNDPNLHVDNEGISIKKSGEKKDSQLNASRAVYISEELDSLDPQVQWHKVVLELEIPNTSCFVEISYYASDENYTPLSESSEKWSAPIRQNPKDALLVDAKGRYLWLKIVLVSLDPDKMHTPKVKYITVYYPRLSYLRYLPSIYQENEASRDFLERFLSLFETFLTSVDNKIFSFTKYIDAKATSDDFLFWLASWLALGIDERWPNENIRKFIKQAPLLYRKRGTKEGLEEIISMYLSNNNKNNNYREDQNKSEQTNGTNASKARDATKDNNNNSSNTCNCEDGTENACGVIIPLFKIVGGKYRIAIIEGLEFASLQDPEYIELYHTKNNNNIANLFSFYVLLDHRLSKENVDVIKRIVENEKPAHTFGCVKVLYPRFYLGMHTYLNINTEINKQIFILEESAIGVDTTLEINKKKYYYDKDYYKQRDLSSRSKIL